MSAKDVFYHIDFAVLDCSANQYNYKEFARNFSNFYRNEDRVDKGIQKEQPYTFFWLDYAENGIFSNWYQRKFVVDDFQYIWNDQRNFRFLATSMPEAYHISEYLKNEL